MDREREAQTRQWMHKLFKIIGITVAALIIGAAVFFVFKLQADAKAVLREAKNTRMALQSADIEMYAKGKSVFNPSNENGIENGVTGLVNQIYKPEGTYRITGYDAKRHEVTGMTYENGHFLVTYQLKGDAIYWDVDYRMNVYHYDDDDIVVR
ncbi:MAG: hypothetical protein IKQ49_09025 [Eubacterium sp.]|nr:hypothetical protein [Eubacterium sp.]MBR6173290.1 hypothetical protein [Eubacterium sp.]